MPPALKASLEAARDVPIDLDPAFAFPDTAQQRRRHPGRSKLSRASMPALPGC
jgi:hypothetical protein